MSRDGLKELSDAQLVLLCQERGARDDRPFQSLFRRHQMTVWRICYNFTRNAHDAEDLTQEVFLKVYRSLNTFESRSSFKTWIYRIAINSCHNEIRRRKSRPQQSETSGDSLEELLPASETVETEWQQKNEREQLAEALSQLPPEALEILHLKDLEQRSYMEIAFGLGIGVSAAKMRVQRARLALRAAYLQLNGKE